MPKRTQVPDPSAVAAHAVSAVAFVQWLDDERDRMVRGLIGRRLRGSAAMRSVVRCALMRFAEGQPLTLAEAQRKFSSRASASSIRADMTMLEQEGLVVLHRVGSGRQQQTQILPTKKLVEWYNGDFTHYIAVMVEAACHRLGNMEGPVGDELRELKTRIAESVLAVAPSGYRDD